VTDRRGHIKLSRKFFEEDPWWNEKRPRTRAEAWLDVLFLASFRARVHMTADGPIPLDRGQFVASLRYLAKRWGWSVKAVRTWSETCQKWARLRAQRETHAGTVYAIVNYDHYQSGGTAEGTAAGTPEGTEGAQLGHSWGTRKKQVSSKAGKESLSEEEQAVVDHYRKTHPKRLRGAVPAKTLRLLRGALEHYGVGDLRSAIDGNAASPFHRENNHMGLDLILRDANKIDYFMGLRETAAKEADTVEMTDEFGRMRLHRRNGNGDWEVCA
jgi:hypothetical protein